VSFLLRKHEQTPPTSIVLSRTMLRAAFQRAPAIAQVSARRGLATAADQSVPLPCTVYGLSGRYANALYVTAVKAKGLPEVAKELKVFNDTYNSNPTLKTYVLDPSVNRKQKTDNMLLMMKSCSETTRKFMGVLCENGRVNEIEAVINDFNTLMQAHKKIVSASVTTVIPLADSEVTAVKDALQGFIEKGYTLDLNLKVDPSIIGGMLVSVGDKSIDLTMARTFQELMREIEAPLH
jgi:F-type H+-transporting ATPase subunit O